MAKIIIPTPLRKFTDNQSVFETTGNTVEEAVREVGADTTLTATTVGPGGDFDLFFVINYLAVFFL